MPSKQYHKISDTISSDNSKSSRSESKWVYEQDVNNHPGKIHRDYEYFQLFDPDDSDIDEEEDPDVRSLLVSKITTYTTLTQFPERKCCISNRYMSCYIISILIFYNDLTKAH